MKEGLLSKVGDLGPLRLAGFLGDAMRYALCLPAEAVAQEGATCPP